MSTLLTQACTKCNTAVDSMVCMLILSIQLNYSVDCNTKPLNYMKLQKSTVNSLNYSKI